MSLCKGKRLNENVNDAAKTILFVLGWRYSMLVRGRGHRRDFLSLGCTLFFTRLICALSIIRHCGHLDHTLHKETCHPAFRDHAENRGFDPHFRFVRQMAPDFSAAILPIRRSPLCFLSRVFFNRISLPFSFHFSFRSSPLLLYYYVCSIRLNELEAWISLSIFIAVRNYWRENVLIRSEIIWSWLRSNMSITGIIGNYFKLGNNYCRWQENLFAFDGSVLIEERGRIQFTVWKISLAY